MPPVVPGTVPDAAWYRADPAALATSLCDASAVQPHMHLDDEGYRVVFRGRYEIRESSELLEAFAVDVVLPTDPPRGIPSVWEVGGRIPRIADPHHVNGDGSLCVVLPEAFWYEYPEGLSLSEYLQGPLRHHLAGQAMLLRGEPWPAGEWGHGFEGMFQFYQELFGTRDSKQLQGFLDLVSRDRVKGHWICPCGSGKKLRHCHGEQVSEVRDRLPETLLVPVRLLLKSAKQRAR